MTRLPRFRRSDCARIGDRTDGDSAALDPRRSRIVGVRAERSRSTDAGDCWMPRPGLRPARGRRRFRRDKSRSEGDGDQGAQHALLQNIDRVRVVVTEQPSDPSLRRLKDDHFPFALCA